MESIEETKGENIVDSKKECDIRFNNYNTEGTLKTIQEDRKEEVKRLSDGSKKGIELFWSNITPQTPLFGDDIDFISENTFSKCPTLGQFVFDSSKDVSTKNNWNNSDNKFFKSIAESIQEDQSDVENLSPVCINNKNNEEIFSNQQSDQS